MNALSMAMNLLLIVDALRTLALLVVMVIFPFVLSPFFTVTL
jgi:hypothetical protein